MGGRIQFTAWLSDVEGTDSVFRVLVDLCLSEKTKGCGTNKYSTLAAQVEVLLHLVVDFDVLLTVHRSIILVINQLNAQILVL